MIPVSITLKNFITYRGQQTLNFDGASLWVLSGANGAGKSSVFDAITFVLYNRHRAGDKKTAKALINHKEDFAEVVFDFRVDNNLYRIRRTLSRHHQSTRQAYYLIPKDAQGSAYHDEPVPDTDKEKGFDRWVKSTIGLEYETFISSVLLLQGQSTKLIDIPPQKRYEVLEELVNLAPYKRLHGLANGHRKNFESQVAVLRNRVNSIHSVSDEDLNLAQFTSEKAKEEWEVAQAEVERLTAIVEQSKQWEQRTRELTQQQAKLSTLCQLLSRASEIDKAYARFQELEQVLPILTSLVENRERLADYQQQIEQLQQDIEQLQTKLVGTEQVQRHKEEKVEQLEQEVSQLQERGMAVARRLAELAPIVAKLSQLEATQAELSQLEEKLAQLPSDLKEFVHKAEEREHQLEEAKQALPWLKQLAKSRLLMSETIKKGLAARQSSESLSKELQEHQNKGKQLNAQCNDASEIENALSNKVIRATQVYEDAGQKLESFEIAVNQPTCELCGQAITPEHIRKEELRLSSQIENAKASLDSLKLQHLEAKEHLDSLTAELQALDKRIRDLEREYGQSENLLNQLRQETRQYVGQIRETFNNLPAIYQVHVTPQRPSDTVGWLDTTYPTSTDLETLSQEVDGRREHTLHLKELRKQLENWQTLQAQLGQTREQLSRLQISMSVEEAEQIRSEQADLQKQQEESAAKIEEKKVEKNQAKADAYKARQSVKELREQDHQHETDLIKNQTAQSEIQHNSQTALVRLSDSWQEQATTIDVDGLKELEEERDKLIEYENLVTELKSARQSIDDLQLQINCLQSEIARIPVVAQRFASEVEQELESLKICRSQLDSKRLAAVGQLDELRRCLEQRIQLEQEQLQAERQHKLYELLSDLLGPEHLQIHLLRRAEAAIVDLANETLDGLSRARLRLELRKAKDESGEQSKQALDLVVYDSETGSSPTAISITSGSQRFRIAVSLALAIGRYAGQEARCIESVIIDEGFGGLDKNGRNDMIHELSELQQQLKRIILVSHQEEFASAFTNGYAIELVNGASKVCLLDPCRAL